MRLTEAGNIFGIATKLGDPIGTLLQPAWFATYRHDAISEDPFGGGLWINLAQPALLTQTQWRAVPADDTFHQVQIKAENSDALAVRQSLEQQLGTVVESNSVTMAVRLRS